MRTKLTVLIIAAVLLLPIVFTGCDSELRPTKDQQEIMENCINLFIHLKVNDHTVLYANEFPYFQEEQDMEEYLAYPAIAGYRADTLLAIEVDSVMIWESDTAYVYMKLEYLFSDSTTDVSSIRMRWWNLGDTIWIRPSASHIRAQQDFEEELRIYWDAVKEIERRDKERQQEEDN